MRGIGTIMGTFLSVSVFRKSSEFLLFPLTTSKLLYRRKDAAYRQFLSRRENKMVKESEIANDASYL